MKALQNKIAKNMSEEPNRRDFFKTLAGGAAAAVGLGADAAEAQRVTKSVDNPAVGEPDMIGHQQGMTPEYIKNYGQWIKRLLIHNEKVSKEVIAVSKLPPEDEKHAELIFSRADNSLPKNLEIIEGNGERVIMHINRKWKGLQEGEVVIVAETYVQKGKAEAYKAKGVNVDGHEGSNEDRLLKASTIYHSKTGQFRRL